MDSGSIEPVPLHRRVRFHLRRLVFLALNRLRRRLGVFAQVLQRDELGELRYETRALGSASAESVSHVGAELREINDRLSKLERELASLGRLLERRAADDTAQEERGEASAQSLSAD
jgi:hypothetical protein